MRFYVKWKLRIPLLESKYRMEAEGKRQEAVLTITKSNEYIENKTSLWLGIGEITKGKNKLHKLIISEYLCFKAISKNAALCVFTQWFTFSCGLVLVVVWLITRESQEIKEEIKKLV